jgi:formate dehydrogenase subunit gamma
MASRAEPSTPGFVRRFTLTERMVHWTHATAFFALLASGLVLYVPSLSQWISRRDLIKNIHIWTAVAWAVALLLVVVYGNKRVLVATWREVESIDRDDRRWLVGGRTPQGRFNAGQKVNAIVTIAFAFLFALSGFFIWLGERNTAYRLDGAVAVHDWLMYVSLILVAGHLYLAVIHPTTRHALRGMTLGDVREDWARQHHPKWVASEAEGGSRQTESDATVLTRGVGSDVSVVGSSDGSS